MLESIMAGGTASSLEPAALGPPAEHLHVVRMCHGGQDNVVRYPSHVLLMLSPPSKIPNPYSEIAQVLPPECV